MAVKPRVTVLIPTFQRPRLLVDAVESVLRQTFDDYEIVITDDSSRDRTGELLERLEHLYPDRVRAVRSDENTGVVLNLNRGLAFARGELIARLDDDDLMMPKRLQRQVAALDEQPNAAACICDAFITNSDASKVFGRASEAFNGGRPYQPGGQERFLDPYCMIAPSTTMVRMSACPPGGFRPELVQSHADSLFYVDVLAAGPLAVVDEPLISYRRHDQNYTNTFVDMPERGLEQRLLLLTMAEERHPSLSREVGRLRAVYYLIEARRDLKRRRLVRAGRLALQAVRVGGLRLPTIVMWLVRSQRRHVAALNTMVT